MANMDAPLLTLPPDVLLHICSFLDTFTLVDCLPKVCRKFESILLDKNLWIQKTNDKFLGIKIFFPEEPQENPWRQLHYQIEKTTDFLDDIHLRRLKTVTNRNVHASARGMKLKLVANEQLCVSASYDRSIALWTIHADDRFFLSHIENAHEDKVTCVDSTDTETFCTGSRDKTCKIWSLETLQSTSTLSCNGKVASLCSREALIATGLHNSKVQIHDTRLSNSKVMEFVVYPKSRNRKIVGVTLEGNHLYTARNDGHLNLLDVCTKEVLKQSRVLCEDSEDDLCYSYRKGTTVIADQYDGSLAFINKDLEELAFYENWIDNFEGAMKQYDFDMLFGRTYSIHQLLKTDLDSASNLYYLHYSYRNEVVNMMDLEYSFDTALFIGLQTGEVILYTREDRTITV